MNMNNIFNNLEKLTNGRYKCPHCGKDYALKGIATHIWRSHGEGFNHKPAKNTTPWNKDLTKDQDSRLCCSDLSKSKISLSNKGKTLSNRSKSKISKSMKKAHKEGRAHNIGKSRWNNEPSYPEKFFMKVIENDFSDKDYVREYSISRYSIDFAWVKKKLAIEIDGQQHEKLDYKARDKRKDTYLENQGWKVLRIKWKDMYNETRKYIQIAKEFIET